MPQVSLLRRRACQEHRLQIFVTKLPSEQREKAPNWSKRNTSPGLSAESKLNQKRLLATIEGGKCLVSWLLESQDPILKASIVPQTKTNLGYTQFKTKERFLQSEESLKDKIAVLGAGKVAQK